MQTLQTWRELLGRCVQTPPERQRIADVLGVAPITLTRWVSGEVNPRPQYLRKLLVALPQYRERLLALLNYARNERRAVAVREIFADDTDAVPCA